MNIAELLQDFLNIKSPGSQKFILAVSGGKDSMAMLHSCIAQKLNIVVAHCNFMLRGQDSIDDELFVRDYCSLNNVECETIKFNTKLECENLGKSTQETARILRYDWFEKLKAKYQADYILTAHHANDLAETFILNIARGSGLNGLTSIPKKNNAILRPLLPITSNKIQNYIEVNNIPFRDDVSNQSDDYTRNYIRHHIVPKLVDVNKNAVPHILETTQILGELKFLVDEKLNELKKQYFSVKNNTVCIDVSSLKTLPYYNYILHDWLRPLGFNSNQITSIINSKNISGNKCESDMHILLINRDELIIEKRNIHKNNTLVFDTHFPSEFCFNNYCFEAKITHEKPSQYQSNVLYFDANKINYPVTIRNWQEGDYFIPLGMKNFKKISDFFIDEKIDQFSKLQLPLICSNKNIIAVAPLRINDNYKITSNTTQILCLKLIK